MSGDRWGPEGPPDEAYSRVTRDLQTLFAPVVEVARRTVDELAAHYNVDRRPASPADLARVDGCVSDALDATVLEPRSGDRSLLIVGVCDLPGVHLAFGRWASEHLPVCGCDACDETPEELLEKLTGVRDLVVGGFGEWARLEAGQWWLGHQTIDGSSEGSLDRAERRELGIREPVELAWQPWRRR
jgi:Family of unknown function (DUF6226)